MAVEQLDPEVTPQTAESDQAPPSGSPSGLELFRDAPSAAGEKIARILRLRVPVIAQLARRMMPVAAVRDLAVGAIIEFDKPVKEPLDVMVNNSPIGRGVCVKIGENFGLRITDICDRKQRVLSMEQV
jgi:flagellar motor switch protein FliN/FliY